MCRPAEEENALVDHCVTYRIGKSLRGVQMRIIYIFPVWSSVCLNNNYLSSRSIDYFGFQIELYKHLLQFAFKTKVGIKRTKQCVFQWKRFLQTLTFFVFRLVALFVFAFRQYLFGLLSLDSQNTNMKLSGCDF